MDVFCHLFKSQWVLRGYGNIKIHVNHKDYFPISEFKKFVNQLN